MYLEFANAHNIAINEDTGFAYAVGTNRCGGLPPDNIPLANEQESMHAETRQKHRAEMVFNSEPVVVQTRSGYRPAAGCHELGTSS
jgi:hypothetical protein